MHRLISSFYLFALMITSTAAFADCDEATRQELKSAKSAGWKLDDDGKRQDLALSAADCLGVTDTELRDELAFEGLSFWMRAEKLSVPALTALRIKMLNAVQAPAAEGSSFLRPFAILTLAELVRVDRKKPYLSAEERVDIVNAGSHYLTNLRDYRGFDAKDGWRHGIAHSADLMLQLAMNPAIEKPQHEAMLAAIASQIAPSSHFYQYGEGVRLMTAVFYLARTPSFNKRDWDLWFNKLMDNSIQAGPYTQARLAQRHNVSAFLLPLYFSVRESTDPAIKENLLPALREALRKVN
ncbi:DUF2785 domain-containing protein [Undibacterium pigrum]|uniref:Uncharacterized protein DUF2785 n=1 Tax=Undibacterium pigrum TaxID=401470 RepID=A0A318IU81_9BURK|nr:DUF2785 domain-containing protein [Undibacterium pigrum]PXX37971.1 uncharacterized protein DUF2785 [Undibacterium pigrum]